MEVLYECYYSGDMEKGAAIGWMRGYCDGLQRDAGWSKGRIEKEWKQG